MNETKGIERVRDILNQLVSNDSSTKKTTFEDIHAVTNISTGHLCKFRSGQTGISQKYAKLILDYAKTPENIVNEIMSEIQLINRNSKYEILDEKRAEILARNSNTLDLLLDIIETAENGLALGYIHEKRKSGIRHLKLLEKLNLVTVKDKVAIATVKDIDLTKYNYQYGISIIERQYNQWLKVIDSDLPIQVKKYMIGFMRVKSASLSLEGLKQLGKLFETVDSELEIITTKYSKPITEGGYRVNLTLNAINSDAEE